MNRVVVTGGFDDLRARHVRFLHEASRYGEVTVMLWSDSLYASIHDCPPRFSFVERQYLLEAVRFVKQVLMMKEPFADRTLPLPDGPVADFWILEPTGNTKRKTSWCHSQGVDWRILQDVDLTGWPIVEIPASSAREKQKKVIVTGCYDWFHSGHVRFFEEAAQFGDLYVAVGHDDNIRLLKGTGHPMFPQEERRYMVHAVRYVAGTFITSGHGWMDAAPEIAQLKPDIYAVNEDGDVPEKQDYCGRNGMQYVVLKRIPKTGLPRRVSTTLRGF
jgi:cytidyltransferase-like protein